MMTSRDLALAAVVSSLISLVLGIALSFRLLSDDAPPTDPCKNPYVAQPGVPCAEGTELLLVGPAATICGCQQQLRVPEMQIMPESM